MSFGRLGALGRGFGRLGGGGKRTVTVIPPNTLIASAATFVLSGEAMTPLVDYRVPSDVAAFVLTGQDATLSSTATGGTARQYAIIDTYLNAEATARSFAGIDQYVVA